jgi:hypothetical protein
MTTRLHDAVTIDPSGLVRVCAWCVPAPRLAELHRLDRCSDGLCPACAVRLLHEVA